MWLGSCLTLAKWNNVEGTLFQLLSLCEEKLSMKNYFLHFARVMAALEQHVPFNLIFRTKSTLLCQISRAT